MTKQEFIDRTGLVETSDKEFEVINGAYMLSDFDKDAFCKMYETKCFGIIECLVEKISNLESELCCKTTDMYIGARMMADKAYQYNDQDLRDESISLYGTKKYLKHQLDNKQLMDQDIKLIKTFLDD